MCSLIHLSDNLIISRERLFSIKLLVQDIANERVSILTYNNGTYNYEDMDSTHFTPYVFSKLKSYDFINVKNKMLIRSDIIPHISEIKYDEEKHKCELVIDKKGYAIYQKNLTAMDIYTAINNDNKQILYKYFNFL